MRVGFQLNLYLAFFLSQTARRILSGAAAPVASSTFSHAKIHDSKQKLRSNIQRKPQMIA